MLVSDPGQPPGFHAESSTVPLTVTQPSGCARAPCRRALVVSSCKAMPTGTASSDGSLTAGPRRVMRPFSLIRIELGPEQALERDDRSLILLDEGMSPGERDYATGESPAEFGKRDGRAHSRVQDVDERPLFRFHLVKRTDRIPPLAAIRLPTQASRSDQHRRFSVADIRRLSGNCDQGWDATFITTAATRHPPLCLVLLQFYLRPSRNKDHRRICAQDHIAASSYIARRVENIRRQHSF